MDPTKLLDTSIPFDHNKLALLDNIVNTFFTTKNNNDREMANKILNEFKLQPDSWLFCDFILGNSNLTTTKIFALGILEDVIKTKWELLPGDQRMGIRNFLVDMLIKNVTDDQMLLQNGHFINKLNFIIVLVAKYEWTSTWPNFMSEICSSSKTNQNLCENNMKILQMLSEEINEFWKSSLTTSKAMELKNQMSKEFSAVFDLCFFIFENSQNCKQTLLIQSVKLFAENIKWFPLEFVFRDDVLTRFLNDIQNITAIRVQVMKCLGEIFGLPLDKVNQEQYLMLKNLTMQIYRNYIKQMLNIFGDTNFAMKYNMIEDRKKSGFEEFSLQFALSIISFMKNNFAYIEEFDFVVGTSAGNEFTQNFMNEIHLGLVYLTQIHQIPNEEIFKATNEFFHWFAFKICFIKEKNADPETYIPLEIQNISLSNYINHTHESFFYRQSYEHILQTVRVTLISKMIKPIEVKIDIDENGDLTSDPVIGTIYQTLHETMRDTLIYLTHLDPLATEKNMLELLQQQTFEENWNPNLLNSVSWAIGCITGAMEEPHEKRFVVMVIKHLLNLCEMKKGKTNKAIVASNIMYVVGQYPRFLNAHWKFLKTVIKKLFEFMHEPHPGVQDFACETFLKISLKCGDQLKIINEAENEPYINVLVRSIKEDTGDLQPHQKLMFYEAIGNMIDKEMDPARKQILIQQVMQPTYSDWFLIFNEANNHQEVLLNNLTIKGLDLILKINERIATSTKTAYWSFGQVIIDNVINTYSFYSNLVNEVEQQSVSNGLIGNMTVNVAVKVFRGFKKSILKYITTLVDTNHNPEVILNQILPKLSNLIEIYRYSTPDNRDADVLLVFSSILEKLKNSQYDYIESIWKYLCLFTLEMIKHDYQSYPEHRMNFFTLVKSLISNAFDSLFQVQDSNFNKDVLNAIIWAFRHDQPLMYETGLQTLLILIKNVNHIRIANNINIADPFYRAFYFDLINDILFVLTDSFHKSGFKLQVEILQLLIQVVEYSQISEGIFDPNVANKDYVFNILVNTLSSAFGHLNRIQIETFCIALFNKCYSFHDFKILIRDFLVLLKSFSSSQDELYEEEKKAQIEEAKMLEEKKRHFIPGMMPIYDSELQKKINSSNYQA